MRISAIAAAMFAALFLVPAAGGRVNAQPTAGVEPGAVEVILAIDSSESMRPALASAKAAAGEFIAAMPGEVRIGLGTFADDVTVLTSPIADRAALEAQLASITTGGDTALYDVVVGASQYFTATAEHKVLVILSDGKDEGSAATLEDAIAASEGLHVEAISLTTSGTDLVSLAALGPVTAAEDLAGLSAAFGRVADLVVEVIEPTTPPTTSASSTSTTAAPTSTVAIGAATATAVEPEPIVASTAQSVSGPPSTLWLWVGAGALFLGLAILGILVVPRHRVSRVRLGINRPKSKSEIGVRTLSAVDEALERYGRRADLSASLSVADVSIKPADFITRVVLVSIVAGAVGLLIAGPVVGVLLATAICLGVWLFLRRQTAKRRAAFADQLPDVLQLLTTSLRSGYGITQAIESVAEEAEEPARSEFAQVLAESRMGRDLSAAMHALAARMASKDLEWVVSAVDINRETGGNLSEVLQKVSVTIRERGRIGRQVRTLTAEGRLSARILVAIPLLMLVWQWRANPDNFALLTEGIGLVALVIAGILMTVGVIWVHRIVNSVSM